MASSQRKQRRAQVNRGSAAAFFAELGRGILAVPSLALGLLVIAVFFQTAAESSSGVWQAIVAFGLAIAASLVGLLLVGWVAARVMGPAAAGWLGIFSGQVPEEFAPDQRNGSRALANLLLLGACLLLGSLLFRHGVREGELNWAIEGLFLAGSGVVLGLLPAVPRLRFARGPRGLRPEPVESEGVITFIVAAALGVGLSLAVSFGVTEKWPRQGPRTLRPLVWHSGCVSQATELCPARARFTLVAAERGRYLVDLRDLCARLAFTAGDGRPVREVAWVELNRAGIETYDKEREIKTRVIDADAGQRIQLEVTTERGEPGSIANKSCVFKVRYRLEAGK
jgi:hypothetical protein